MKIKASKKFDDINQSKNQLQDNINQLNETLNTSKKNYELLVTIENELTMKINEVKDLKIIIYKIYKINLQNH